MKYLILNEEIYLLRRYWELRQGLWDSLPDLIVLSHIFWIKRLVCCLTRAGSESLWRTLLSIAGGFGQVFLGDHALLPRLYEDVMV